MFDRVGKQPCPICGHLMTSHSLGKYTKRKSRVKILVDAMFCEECKGEGIATPCFIGTPPRIESD